MSTFLIVSLVLFSCLPFEFYPPEAERLKERLNKQLLLLKSCGDSSDSRKADRRIDPVGFSMQGGTANPTEVGLGGGSEEREQQREFGHGAP